MLAGNALGLLLAGLTLGGTALGQGDPTHRHAYAIRHAWLMRASWAAWIVADATNLTFVLAVAAALRRPLAWVAAAALAAAVVHNAAYEAEYLAAIPGATPAALAASEARMAVATAGSGHILYAFGFGALWLALRRDGWCARRHAAVGAAVLVPFVLLGGIVLLRHSVAQAELWSALLLFAFTGALWYTGESLLAVRWPTTAWGPGRAWRAAARGPYHRVLAWIARSRVVKAAGRLPPLPGLRSDITDVVYVSYVVPVARVAHLVPAGLELQRVGPRADRTVVTFLTFRHHHFGPAFLGPLRRAMPSPAQSNWRLHVRNPSTGNAGVYFLATAMTNPAVGAAARILGAGLPMHPLARGSGITWTGPGQLRLLVDPGHGSGPDAQATLHVTTTPGDGPWAEAFPSWQAALAHIVPQDRAFVVAPERLVRQEIDLGIPLDACIPLQGDVRSDTARGLVGEAQPFCFLVPNVPFRFTGERVERAVDVGAAAPAPVTGKHASAGKDPRVR